MLVAVALVVLMMTLFATIFQVATGTMATQKGLAENDQRVRMAMTMLRGDLKYRTMQLVVPFAPGENVATDPNINLRKGYLYIAENDPDDDTDDVLQFTVLAPTGQDEFYGAARALLWRPTDGFYGPNGPSYPAYQIPYNGVIPPGNYWPNQPEFDDGIVGIVNGAGSSPAAEVSYFLRNGTLYRRVMLIREPSVVVVGNDHDPLDNANNALSTAYFEDPTTAAPRNFYTYFDYSAYFDPGAAPNPAPTFHGIGSLDNGAASTVFALGKPNFRFGHNRFTGLPREFVDRFITIPGTAPPGAPNGMRFIGRFTHWETSYENPNGAYMYPGNTAQYFGYPGKIGPPASPFPNPYDSVNVPLTLDTSAGVVVNYSQWDATLNRYITGPRAAEDVLLRNVLRFDIKVWDEAASAGPDGQPGRAQQITGAGPDGILGTPDDPTQPYDDDLDNTPNNNHEYGWPGSDDGAFVDLGHSGAHGWYRAGALLNYNPNNGLSYYCPLIDPTNANSKRQFRYDTWHPAMGDQVGGTAGTVDPGEFGDFNGNGTFEPNEAMPPFRPCAFFGNGTVPGPIAPGVTGVDDDNNGIMDWDNNGYPDLREIGLGDDVPIPLKAIQVHITFIDPATNQIRDVTMVYSLAPNPP